MSLFAGLEVLEQPTSLNDQQQGDAREVPTTNVICGTADVRLQVSLSI
jgi:hypothetical protein